MERLVYFLTIFSLLGSSSCVSNRAFRDLNKKVNLLKTSFQRDVDDLKASFQQEVDDLKFEVLDLKTKLHLEEERTERLEQLLSNTGSSLDIDVSKPEDDVENGEGADLKRLTKDVGKLKKTLPMIAHVQESLRQYESNIQENREDIRLVQETLQTVAGVIKKHQETQDPKASSTIFAVVKKAFQGEKKRARKFEKSIDEKISNKSKAEPKDVEHLRRDIDTVTDAAQKNAMVIEDIQYELKHVSIDVNESISGIADLQNDLQLVHAESKNTRPTFDTISSSGILATRCDETLRVVDDPVNYIRYIRYDDSCYLFSDHTLTFSGAQMFCKQFNANLVHVNDAAENTFIKRHIDGKSWIGLSDYPKEGDWRWVDTDDDLKYSYWAPGEPNDRFGTEDCAAFWPHSSFESFWKSKERLLWYDIPCTSAINPVCEMRFSGEQ